MSTTLSGVRNISAGGDGSVWAVSDAQEVYRYDGVSHQWQSPPGAPNLIQISVGGAANVWGVDGNSRVWKYVGDGRAWEQVATQPAIWVSLGSDGTIMGVSNPTSEPAEVWTGRTDGPNFGVAIAARDGTSEEIALVQVSVAEGSEIWGIDTNGTLWKNVGPTFWQSKGGDLVQLSALKSEVWGTAKDGTVWRYADSDQPPWTKMGRGLRAISVGSPANAWGIDMSGTAVCLAPGGAQVGARWVPAQGEEQWAPEQRKRWDSTDKYDQTKSTHLWIVSRAAELARSDPNYGQAVFDLVKPGSAPTPGASDFHDALAQGLWDADEADPYRNSDISPAEAALILAKVAGIPELNVDFGSAGSGLSITATYKSHFYDPDTGLNWLNEDDPTAYTQAPYFFRMAVDQYKAGNLRAAGYNLGLSLHYLTDMTQPMHASNFTNLDFPLKYHAAYEGLAIEVMNDIHVRLTYTPSTLGWDPHAYVKAAAQQSKPRSARIVTKANKAAYLSSVVNYFHSWKDDVKPEIVGGLLDAVTITAQYLVIWMEAAQPAQPIHDLLAFTQIHAGKNSSYWAVDNEGHLFQRDGWAGRWAKVSVPTSDPVISVWIDDDGSPYIVAKSSAWHRLPDKTWNQVYPPELTDSETLTPYIRQLAVVAPAVLWALGVDGTPYRGTGLLPEVTWEPTSPANLSWISASSGDSAWGVNQQDKSVWEFVAGHWENRGSGIVQVSVDREGKPWGISADGSVVTFTGSMWKTPPGFTGVDGNKEGTVPPDWGPLAWINARGELLVVDRRGVAWAVGPLVGPGMNPWMPLG